jgi:alanyl-tRNA synthetase
MDEMNELYYREPYTKEFDADLVSMKKVDAHYETVLSDTAFYPEGGGQAADTGTLNGVRVYDVQNHDGTIVHYTKAPVEGEKVHGVLDWEERFVNMQLHSADHIFSGLIHKHFGYDNVGFGMSDHGVRMDFNGPVSEEEIRQIELEANEAVWANLPIEEAFPDHDALEKMEYRSKKELTGKVRIITIPGYDVCACCGTHVARTGEIGAIRIYSCEKYKGGVRGTMLAGKRALEEDNLLAAENRKISVALSAEPQHTSEAVEALQNQLGDLRKKIGELNGQLLSYKLNDFEEGSELAVDFEEGIDRNLMIHLANDLCDTKHIGTAAILNRNEKGYAYVILSRTHDLRTMAKDINGALHGRGGGKPEMIQGSFSASEEDIRDTLEQFFRTEE